MREAVACTFENGIATNESVPRGLFGTSARWDVIDDVAESILTTCSGARVAALIPDASFVSVAFIADNAFRSAVAIRIPVVFGKASAHSIITPRIRTAGTGITGIGRLNWFHL